MIWKLGVWEVRLGNWDLGIAEDFGLIFDQRAMETVRGKWVMGIWLLGVFLGVSLLEFDVMFCFSMSFSVFHEERESSFLHGAFFMQCFLGSLAMEF